MNEKQPLVSVIMSVYNCADTLFEAIQSIVDQTYKNWEFIICNDASSDATQSVLDRFKEEYPDKFILLSNEKNMYLSFSLNRCLAAASGEYIARMDGDDLSEKERLEKQVAFLNAHPEFQVVGTTMRRFNNDGLFDVVSVNEYPNRNQLKYGVPFCHATIMMRKNAYDRVGGYKVSEMTVRSQDYDMWFRFYHEKFEGYNIQEPLYLVREDLNAIKRRTWNNRWNIAKIQLTGYRLLGFPRIWYLYPCVCLLKGLVPAQAQLWWRKRKWKAGVKK